jgi:hypothetical protein
MNLLSQSARKIVTVKGQVKKIETISNTKMVELNLKYQ